MFNAMETKNACVKWIRDWFEQNGKGCTAVLGISGGADSTIAAALCKEALGKDRVLGVLMPNGTQPDIDDSYEVVKLLDIRHVYADISSTYDSVVSSANRIFSYDEYGFKRCEYLEITGQAHINLLPRIRMSTLYFISQSVNGRVVNTCNLSEDFIGYLTRYGDGAGDFAPLGGMTKTEVVAVGDTLGLPEHLVHKIPSDGLCHKTDEDNFGFSYTVLDHYIRTGECENVNAKEKIDALHQKNQFKFKPIPSFRFD